MDNNRRARSEERRRRRQKEVRRTVILLAVVFAVILIGVGTATVLFLRGREKPVETVSQNSTAAASNEGGNTSVSTGNEPEASDPEGKDGTGTDNTGTDGTGADASTGEDGAVDEAQSEAGSAPAGSVMDQAALLAAQYDYDGALNLLSGAEQTAEVTAAVSEYQNLKNSCVAVDVTRIPHVFFHSLINDDRAFKTELVGPDRVRQNNAAMTTSHEFDVMMQAMYDAGYVLVSLDDMCVKTTDENGVVHIAQNTSLMLPPDKKAFVLSVDDLSYYHTYGIGTQGYATRMLVDENGKPKCEYTNENGETLIGDYDVVPRLDTFIDNHPDFCYRGARGTVAMTGYNGVFGYRTNDYYKDINNENLDYDQIQFLQEHPDFNWEEDCARAKEVADAMKAEGWTFASHTYGHLNAESASLDRLVHDNERWMTCNHPILGDIDKIIFAFGADIGYLGEYTSANDKFTYFKSQGYNIFCNVDGNIGWTEFGDTFMRTGRVALDGFTMYQAMTEGAVVHSIYANDYEVLGIHDIASFFNPLRPTPINSE